MQLSVAQDLARDLLDRLRSDLALEGAAAGSLALGCHKILTREIKDVDVVCRPPTNDAKLIHCLRSAGYELGGTVKVAKVSLSEGKLRLYRDDSGMPGGIPVELFVPARFNHPSGQAKALCDETYRSIGTCPSGSGLRVVSPEICITWKLLFGRPTDEQDLVDVRTLANEQGVLLNTVLIEKHLAALAGTTSRKMEVLRKVFFSEEWYASISGEAGNPRPPSFVTNGRQG